MIKLVFFCTIFLSAFIIQNCSSNAYQPPLKNTPRPDWLASEFKEVMMIESSNTAENDGFFLVNQCASFSKDVVPVFFISAHIPLTLFKNPESFYPELDEFILIIPDWEFYNKIAADASESGISVEPATSNYYYRFRWIDGKVEIDDYYISGNGHPTIDFKNPEVPKTALTVFRREQYGSVCCPRDEKHALSLQDAAFIKNHEQQHQVKIDGTFRENNGKEGEHIIYYTLRGLNAKQKLDFLLAKNKQWQINGKHLFDPNEKRIITPIAVPIQTEGFNKFQAVAY